MNSARKIKTYEEKDKATELQEFKKLKRDISGASRQFKEEMELIIGDDDRSSDSVSDEEANKARKQIKEYEKRYAEQEKKAEEEYK